MSETTWVHDASAVCWPCSTRVSPFCTAPMMAPYLMPLNGMTPVFANAFARSLNSEPIGALLKKALCASLSVLLEYAAVWLGKFPAVLNAEICWSGAVSQSTNAFASAVCLPWVGTRRYEPPQLPPPFGNTLAMFQSVTFGLSPWMTPIIHGGQSMVANLPAAIPPDQSVDHSAR